MSLLQTAVTFLWVVPLFAAEGVPGSAVTVHEWGTFTSVAGLDGRALSFQALAGPADLPCFVFRWNGRNIKAVIPSTVRMETPVLYFYAPRNTTLSVHVGFPQGFITEWYPQGHVQLQSADWGPIEVSPGESLTFPQGSAASHYYAARHTDSAPIRAGQEQEKMIFYRGIGDFSIPLQPRLTADGKLEIRNTGASPIPEAVVFENRGGKIGYRVVSNLTDSVKVEMPELGDDFGRLTDHLAGALTEMGLYPKEAAAMIETWRDSWFEEGTRVVYLFPRASVDAVLPLTVTPAPEAISRVFVGRVEVLSPATQQAIQSALAEGNLTVLEKYGRFLQAFVTEMERSGGVIQSPAARSFLASRRARAESEYYSPSCAK